MKANEEWVVVNNVTAEAIERFAHDLEAARKESERLNTLHETSRYYVAHNTRSGKS